MSQWSTDVTLPVDQSGNVDFTGFYGDYDVTVAGQTYHLSLDKGDTTYALTIHSGDFNGDGVVNMADYTVWRHTVGSTTDLRADANGDGVVNDADYGVWRSLFGTSYAGAALAAGAAVPEPASCALCLAVFCSVFIVGRRR